MCNKSLNQQPASCQKSWAFETPQSTAATSACYLSLMAAGCLYCDKAERAKLLNVVRAQFSLSAFLTCVHPSFSLLPHFFLLYFIYKLLGEWCPVFLCYKDDGAFCPGSLLLCTGGQGHGGSLQKALDAGPHFSICLDAPLDPQPQLHSLDIRTWKKGCVMGRYASRCWLYSHSQRHCLEC